MFKPNWALAAFICAFSAVTSANMRAPMNTQHAPSFSLASPQSTKLTVQRETLDIDCDYVRCFVEANYYIVSETAAELAFVFIMPSNTPVAARVAGEPRPAKVTRDGSQTWETRYGWPRGTQLPLYQAAFTGKVNAGENTIVIQYSQPLTILERAYGYFTDSRSIEQFTYQLGPLKEWQLADDFSLEVRFSSLRKRPDRDGGWSLFRSRDVDCMQPEQTIEKDSEYLTLTKTFGKDFPDTLVCQAGDSGLLDSRL